MRVALLGMGWSPDQPGGLNRYVRGLRDGLEQAGVEVTTLVVGPAVDAPSGVVAVSDRRASLLARLRAYTDAIPDADVVDAHFALYAFAPLVGRKLRGRPFVVHFHGPWATENVSAGDRRTLARRLRRLVERRVYRAADEAVVLSNAFRRVLVEEYGVVPWRVSVIPPGVDLERFSPGDRSSARRQLELEDDELVAIAARRLVPRMGLDVLVDAWSRLDGKRTLVVVGDGPSRTELGRLAADRGAPVRFLGRVDDATLVAAYRAADVAVLPSLELEGFGLAALEALACGTPVVGTDAGGLPEVLAPLDPTLVIAAGDTDALAARLQDRALPAREACRAYAQGFTWERAAERNVAVYRRAGEARPRTIRVVYVGHTAKLSGGELALLRLLPELDVEAHVILAEDGPLVARLQAAGVSVEVMPLAAQARTVKRGLGPAAVLLAGPATALYALRLARRLRRLRPDLVHTNTLKAALYGGVAGRLARVPVVWHVRDRIAGDYLSPLAARAVHLAVRRLPTAVIANSASTLATLGELRAPSCVISSPVGRPAPRAPHDGVLRVGMVGRIAPWKGQHVFLEAFASAFGEGDETGRIIGAPLFGPDEEHYLGRLREQAEQLGLGSRVELTGFRDDIAAELAQLDVLVHASVVAEPFGQVVVEGMAAGVAVVAAAAGGPAELIEDGVDGLLYAPGDVPALAEALRRLAADPRLRSRLGAAARERARVFEPDRIAAQVQALYAALVA
jgi:glycosyltransferase involved in cell wall biosynthesis